MTLQKSIDSFKKNQVMIIKHWLTSKAVQKILKKHQIDIEFFIRTFAVNILDYYIAVVKQEKSIGDCPTIDELLKYLKDKKISTDQLFVICSNFRSSLLFFAHKSGLDSFEIREEIDLIFEKNFEGVLSKYSETVFGVKDELHHTLDLIDKHVLISRVNLEGKIIDASNALCYLTGYKKEELLNQSSSILRLINNPNNEMWEVLKSGKTWHGEMQNRKKDGTTFWVYMTAKPMFDDKGVILYYDFIRQNITSRKAATQQNKIIVEQAKSAAMGELISMIAHQWRQPLQSISILVQKLLLVKMMEGSVSNEVIDETVEDVEVQITYMSKTIDDFRDFFKPNKQKQICKLSYIINKALEFLSYMLTIDSIQVKIEIKNDIELYLFENNIIQVLINIMKNAKDAMHERKIQEKKLIIRYDFNEDYAIIEIEDNAGGIPENYIDKIFEPYFSTKKDKNGTGLGLYMSKTIIEDHSSGKLTVKNVQNGALFRLELPLK